MRSVLGELSPSSFLRDYWQKRPLVVRQAIPGFDGILDRDALFGLAMLGDATSRLVLQHPRRRSAWERHDGPFGGLDVTMLPKSHWTLLVHGIESLVPGGWELLREFSFIPAARIDDLMVSYAADAGSVGPHDDRYDVFLLQGPGRRRWQVMSGGHREVDPRAAIRVLASFVAEDEWLLEPGDMLYLPPGVAHWGVAEGPCFTYSIGFLAPSHEALIQNFLGYLGQALAPRIDPDALYRDPDLTPPKDPLAIGDAMVQKVASVVGAIRWDRSMVEEFLGRFLTGPKPHVVFAPPRRPLLPDAFARRLRGRGRLTLALASRGLTRGGQLFFNGETHPATRATQRRFEELVGTRSLALPLTLDRRALELFHAWYAAGYLRLSGR
ncbi:MAG TPA: cupin domain-containing protein [Polyangia bacterium]|nr:cupin domain-containing protein [Polyangia bacterium]